MEGNAPKDYAKLLSTAPPTPIVLSDLEAFVKEHPGVDRDYGNGSNGRTSFKKLTVTGTKLARNRKQAGPEVDDPLANYLTSWIRERGSPSMRASFEGQEGDSVSILLNVNLYELWDCVHEWTIYKQKLSGRVLDNGWFRHAVRLAARYQWIALGGQPNWWKASDLAPVVAAEVAQSRSDDNEEDEEEEEDREKYEEESDDDEEQEDEEDEGEDQNDDEKAQETEDEEDDDGEVSDAESRVAGSEAGKKADDETSSGSEEEDGSVRSSNCSFLKEDILKIRDQKTRDALTKRAKRLEDCVQTAMDREREVEREVERQQRVDERRKRRSREGDFDREEATIRNDPSKRRCVLYCLKETVHPGHPSAKTAPEVADDSRPGSYKMGCSVRGALARAQDLSKGPLSYAVFSEWRVPETWLVDDYEETKSRVEVLEDALLMNTESYKAPYGEEYRIFNGSHEATDAMNRGVEKAKRLAERLWSR
jgi:hypothetical protein